MRCALAEICTVPVLLAIIICSRVINFMVELLGIYCWVMVEVGTA